MSVIEPGAASEFEDEYSAALKTGFRELGEALLNDRLTVLEPTEPICVRESTSVHETVARMLSQGQAGVLVVDGEGRLLGIFTERDLLTRVAGPRVMGVGPDVHQTPVSRVMTANPEALSLQDRVCSALNRMSVAGYRTVPIVDGDNRPVGIVTANHVMKWLTNLFPEAILNLPPEDRIKHPLQMDAG